MNWVMRSRQEKNVRLDRRSQRSRLLIVGVLFLLGACSDAATRAARDIESGAKGLGSADGARLDVSYTPRSWPDGCSGSYTLRIEKGAAIGDGHGNFRLTADAGGLLVRCYGSDGKQHGWGTTYHLRFVDVPATVEVTKDRGEAALVALQRVGGRPVVIGVH